LYNYLEVNKIVIIFVVEFKFNQLKSMYLSYEQVKKLNFKTGNRPVQMSHVKKLLFEKKILKNGMWNMLTPVSVNKRTNNIMNGQHRTTGYLWCVENGYISKDTKLKVDYVDIPVEEEIETIRQMNGGKNWNNNTIVESKAAEGNPNYVQLLQFCNANELLHTGKTNRSYRSAVAMMTGRRINFEKEEFVYSSKIAECGQKVHDEMVAILQILNIAKGDAGVEGMAMSWYHYRTDHKWGEWKSMIASTKRSINSRRTPGKSEWEDFFRSVSYKIDHKGEKKAEF